MDGLQIPGYFGRASDHQQAPSADAWANLDTLDVDLLAEYLLDDNNGSTSGEVTFDFSMDASQRGSSMISPDNSEDGGHPPLADKRTAAAATMAANNNLLKATNNVYGLLPNIPAAATAAPPLMPSNAAVFMPAPSQGGLVTYHHGANQVDLAADLASKRRRLDGMAQIHDQQQHHSMQAQAHQQLLFAGGAQDAMAGRGRKKSQQQIDRRRERNRILARRTRLRKKFFFESLQKEVMDLQRENEQLKEIVKEELDAEQGKAILDECDAMERLPNDILQQCAQEMSLDEKDSNLVKSIQQSQYAFVITDPSLQDNPIVYASDDFLKQTGYNRDQVLGRNCRFLQGADTSPEHVQEIRSAIAKGEDVSVTILNYTANGTPFWNRLFIAALRDADNNVVNFIGVVVPIAKPVDPEDDKNEPDDEQLHDGYDEFS
jgi:PAS domain S-box-containing protein